MKRKILKILSLMIALLLLMTALPAQAAKKGAGGSIEIQYGNTSSVFKRDEIYLNIYLVATGDYGNWTLEKPYKGIKVFTSDSKDEGTKWIDDSMKLIHSVIKEKGIGPYQKAQSNLSGKVTFSGLPRGIYYIEMTKGPEGMTGRPMLLSLPAKNGSYVVSAAGKYDYNPSTPTIPNLPPPPKGKHYENIDEYETALGLGNIQIHVGVCYE